MGEGLVEKALLLTAHAQIRLHGRDIDHRWIERTARDPDWTSVDPRDPTLERRYKVIPEFGHRILRVVCAETDSTIRVISVLFDRNARRRHD